MTVLVRALVSWLFALAAAAFVFIAALILAFGNFVVAWQSFMAQGFEPTPLRSIPLLGAWSEGFGAGDATIAALFALGLTVGMNTGIILSAKVLVSALHSVFDRRQALRSAEPAVQGSAPDYRDDIIRNCVFGALLIIGTAMAVAFDLNQFELRYNILFTEDVDAASLLGWAPDPVARVGEFLAGFIRTAKWGYLGCVIVVAVGLEYAIARARLTWIRLHNGIEEAVSVDSLGRTDDARMFSPMRAAGRFGEDERSSRPDLGSVNESAIHAADPPSDPPADPTPVEPPAPAEPPPAQTPQSEDAMVTVVTGPGRTETFSRAEVEADHERFVRDGSGRTWFLRSYWQEVIDDGGHKVKR